MLLSFLYPLNLLLYLVSVVSCDSAETRIQHKAELTHLNRILSNFSSLNSSHSDPVITYGYKEGLRNRVQALFNHTYNAYMLYAYPHDELMPLSCSGRNRGVTPSRGDVDEALGNFSLTLIDTLDTLAIMGQIQEFSHAIRRVIRQVTFNANLTVSVFETNIRVLGGLLSGHVLAEHLKARGHSEVAWYRGQLLDMSTELAQRLIPAFYSETGIPYPRVNLRTGEVTDPDGRGKVTHSTCTACAGTLLLEFGALSRLTGNPFWESKAKGVMRSIWERRDEKTQLVGSVIDVENGKWLRTDCGVGAGLDSYFEYLLKGYILFGDHEYWDKFRDHYLGIDKYIRKGIHMVQVNMDNPSRPIRSYTDSLTAFWPGLQVLAGDVAGAKRVYEGFLQVVNRWEVLPEAYNFDLEVHWSQHHLRPEFIESTLSLYQATGSHKYLEIGEMTLEFLEKHAKVECGLAALEDVKSKKLADRLDSFVLAETLKYLYLLFSEEKDLPIKIDEFIFTTEAHLLPLSLSTLTEGSSGGLGLTSESCIGELHTLGKYLYIISTIPAVKGKEDKNQCSSGGPAPILSAHELDLASESHRQELSKMGISIKQQENGNLQLVYNPANSENQQQSAAGTQLMQDLIKLAETGRDGNGAPINSQINFRSVIFNEGSDNEIVCLAGTAMFGRALAIGSFVQGNLVVYTPLKGCDETTVDLSEKVALIERGGCLFQEKAINAQNAGAIGVIIFDDSDENNKLITMSGESGVAKDSLVIPAVFIASKEGRSAKRMLEEGQEVSAKIVGEALLERLEKKHTET